MNEKELEQVLEIIQTIPVGEGNESAKLLMKMAADSIAMDKLKVLPDTPRRRAIKARTEAPPKGGNTRNEEVGYLKFTKKELAIMPKSFQSAFIIDNRIVKYRFYEGLFQARYRRDGYNIEVASKDFDTMKRKFIERLTGRVEPQKKHFHIRFCEYAEEWLKLKKQTTKPSTYKEYERMYNTSIKPVFEGYTLTEITRTFVQEFLFKYVGEGKHRTADKLKLLLNCIFDMAAEDYQFPSPMKKIVLPYHESKKGSAFTKEEETRLVEFCKEKQDNAASSALLVLLYFGLRQSELKSLRIVDGKYLECETSKELLGRNVVIRRIPFTPVFRRVLAYVDFEKAKETNPRTVATTLKRLFPKHHPHELRYTYITRCKECGVNPELVMLWDGHSQDSDVKTSRVDRGYTDYSEDYILAEAEKVNYLLEKVA